MVNITLAVPEELKKEMDKFPEINWSALVREAIKKRILLFKQIKEFTNDSELTEEDAIRLGRKVNKAVHRRHEEFRKKEKNQK